MWINAELICDVCIDIWSKTCALVCQGCHSKVLLLRGLQKCIFTQFWSPQVWGQRVGRFGFFWSFSLWLVDACLLQYSYIVFLLCTSVSIFPLLIRTPVKLHQAAPNHPILTKLPLKVPISNYSTSIRRYRELELQQRSAEKHTSSCNGLFSLKCQGGWESK